MNSPLCSGGRDRSGKGSIYLFVLEIEAKANERLVDEYDTAQDRGKVQKPGGARGNQHVAIVPASDNAAKVTDLGLIRQQVAETLQVRDAEKASPGIVKRTLDRSRG